MNRSLSVWARPGIIDDLESATFDVLVIGGGITGAGIAWDAAKRGMKTALIEKGDFAAGTSSRSTKLIHGGLRYLKKGELRLVREVGREREWLYRNAPHLVTPMPMLLPIYKGGTFGYRSTSLGLLLYDWLAGVRRSERRQMLGVRETLSREPLLKTEGLKGSGCYYEYRSDDARLTVEVVKTAVRHGAWAVNYVEAVDFIYYRSKVCGVKAVDHLTGREVEIRAKRIINAAGPWVDPVRSRDHAIKGRKLLLTKGVHLVVDYSKLPVRQAAYFDVPDGRMIFVIPRDGKTYIGTTDTPYTASPDNPRTTEQDRDYLLKAVRYMFPKARLDADDVEAMWAGLRPLIHEDGKHPSDISRKDEVWVSSSGLITIAGGKLTGFRKMAEKVVNQVASSLEAEGRFQYGHCTTAEETISGGDSGRCESFEEYREQLVQTGVRKGLSSKQAEYLVRLYGSHTADIYMRIGGAAEKLKEAVYGTVRLPEPWDQGSTGVFKAVTEAAPEAIHQPEYSELTGIYIDAEEMIQQEDLAATAEVQPEDVVEAGEQEARLERDVLEAEITYCLDEEMIVHADDFLVRRTGLIYFDRQRAEAIAWDVLDIMAEKLGWSPAELERQKLRLAHVWEAATAAVERE